jgi:voltage-gated potassium channel
MKRIEIAYELLMFTLVVISLLLAYTKVENYSLYIYIVLFIFVIDYTTRFVRAENKWAYVKSHPFELIALIPLDAIFRAARFVRIFRIIRLFGIGSRFFKPVYRLFKTNGLDKLLIFTLIMLFLIPIPVVYIEPEINTFGDGIWWAIVTTTTVGYGDFSPVTGLGRFLAVVLMLVGIGIIGTFTSAVSTYFRNARILPHDKQVLRIIKNIEETDSLTEEDAELIKLHMKRKSVSSSEIPREEET